MRLDSQHWSAMKCQIDPKAARRSPLPRKKTLCCAAPARRHGLLAAVRGASTSSMAPGAPIDVLEKLAEDERLALSVVLSVPQSAWKSPTGFRAYADSSARQLRLLYLQASLSETAQVLPMHKHQVPIGKIRFDRFVLDPMQRGTDELILKIKPVEGCSKESIMRTDLAHRSYPEEVLNGGVTWNWRSRMVCAIVWRSTLSRNPSVSLSSESRGPL
ncbi:protein of unknown function (plasmid) [Cupriavidus taiwanensis]|uniref:Uncharacterized protein n=1 Tax=Cupriavidus taiwanensis TaxID=164546 RepID=A0A375ISX0_9BURK|nr:protein of unknown function [Cupriavidus taiwanensis]